MYELSDTSLKVLPVEDSMLLPRTTVLIRTERSDNGFAQSFESGGVAVPIKTGTVGVASEDYQNLGVRFTLKNVRHTEGKLLLEIQTGERVRINTLIDVNDGFFAEVTNYPETKDLDAEMEEQMLSSLKDIIKEMSKGFRGSLQYIRFVDSIQSINSMIVHMSKVMPSTPLEKFEYLKIDSMKERSLKFMDDLLKHKEAVAWNLELSERLSERTNKYYRDQMLREQMKAIKKELGEDGGEESDGKKSDYRTRIEEAELPEQVRKAALDEAAKLEAQPMETAETSVIRNYLDFILALPWKKEPADDVDLNEAERILNEDHYGLEKVKKRIVEHLAVMKLRNDSKGSILLLVGPPGTGKTSLGKSIARALNREYVRLSLGGIRDESEIRGHRRTYVGALPGRILNAMKQAGKTNPVMVLDEVDKLSAGGFSGDPSAALLEVLDPEQNTTFTDHYLDLPYDLSNVFFIATANSTDTIPAPLLDRMETIEISSYTEEEKYHIAKEHLLPDVLKDTGIEQGQMDVTDEALKIIISDYTREGGVRGLKKALLTLARSVSADIVKSGTDQPRIITEDDLSRILGRRIVSRDKASDDNPPGVVTGLAWTPVGGEILFIESADMPGKGEVILTGQLGDVMKESARISLSLLESRLPMNSVNFRERNIHVHVPSGAVPKDGPSAGITIFTSLASLLTGIKVDSKLAMTGEVTLRGAVTAIGGLKEKLIAADRAGIKKVLIPKENEEDLADVPDAVKEHMTIIPVETIEDVLRETININLPKPEHLLDMNALTGISSQNPE